MRKSLLMVVVALLAVTTVAWAETKIGVVDVQRVIDDSEKGQQARELLKQKFEQEKTALEKEGKEIALLKEDFDKQSAVLTPEKRADREQELRQRIKDFNRLKKDKQDSFNAQQMEVLRQVMAKVMEVVQTVAKENGYTAVFDATNGPVLYAGEGVDITDLIIQRFNQASGGKP
jgi:outer membrane protein